MKKKTVKPIPSVPGALARSDGMVLFPSKVVEMPNGGFREYKTKWVRGVATKASKSAKHEYFGVVRGGVNYKVHRLICEAFHGPQPKNKPIVLHLNEDAKDNRPENLRWGTQKENFNMPKFLEYCRSRTGEDSPRVKGMRARQE